MNEFFLFISMKRDSFTDLNSSIYYTEINDASEIENLKEFLHQEELKRFNSYTSDTRKQSFVLGRYCAKKALQKYSNINIPSSIWIEPGVFNQPVIKAPNMGETKVSISHSRNAAIAAVYNESHPMSVDIEQINASNRDSIYSQLTEREKSIVQLSGISNMDRILTTLWTAKECLGKVLTTGLTCDMKLFEIDTLVLNKDNVIECTFNNFIQYKTSSILYNDKLITILIPKRTNICLRN